MKSEHRRIVRQKLGSSDSITDEQKLAFLEQNGERLAVVLAGFDDSSAIIVGSISGEDVKVSMIGPLISLLPLNMHIMESLSQHGEELKKRAERGGDSEQ